MGENRPWTIAVVCGESGVGKSSVARPLALRYGVPLGEVALSPRPWTDGLARVIDALAR